MTKKILYKSISFLLSLTCFISFIFNGLNIAQAGVQSASVVSSGVLSAAAASPLNFSLNSFQADLYKGEVSYTIPISVPEGRKGVAPQLALGYSSQVSNSWCGVGWNLQLGSIERSMKNGFPQYNANDTFTYNGSELVKISSNEYRLKTDNAFMRFFNNGTSWEVIDKSGIKYYFESGVTTPLGVFNWCLKKVTDLHGNYMSVTYYINQNQIYPQKIVYTGNENTAMLPCYSVDFNLDARNDKVIQHLIKPVINPSSVPTVSTSVTAYRLKNIEVKFNNSLIRKYELNYKYSACTKRSLLESVRMFGSDGTTAINPVSFQYDETVPQIQMPPENSVNFYTSWGTPLMGDFNGDGINDICMALYETFTVYLGNADGSFSPGQYWGNYADGNAGNYQFSTGDFNADGYTDIFGLRVSQDQTFYNLEVAFSNGSSFAWGGESFYDALPPLPPMFWPPMGPPFIFKRFLHVISCDMNKDGRTDIIVADHIDKKYTFYQQPDFTGKLYTYKKDGTGFEDSGFRLNLVVGASDDDLLISSGDFNADGCLDLMFGYEAEQGTCQVKVALYPDYFSPSITFPSTWIYDYLIDDSFLSADVNYDGFSDLVRFYPLTGGWDVALSDGTHFTPRAEPWCPAFGGTRFPLAGNFDLSGVIVPGTYYNRDGSGEWQFAKTSSPNTRADYLLNINNGVGGSVNIIYRPYQESALPFVHYVVNSITNNNGMGNSYTTIYEYSNASFDRAEREFRGFGQVKVIDAEGNYSQTYFHQDNILKGKIYRRETHGASGALYTKQETSWTSNQPYSGVYNSFVTEDNNYNYEGGAFALQTRVRYEYDNYGNVDYIGNDGDIAVYGDEKAVFNEYAYNTALNIVSLPSHTWVQNSLAQKVSEQWFEYDGGMGLTKGLLTRQESWLETGANPYTTYAYDNYGMPFSQTDALGRTTTTEYDTTYHLFPEKVRNAKGQEVNSTFDPKTCQVLTSRDPNNQTTTYQYDVLGRVTKIIGPNDTEAYPSVSYEYNLSVFPSRIITNIRKTTGTPEVVTTYAFYDGLGRCVQTRSPANDIGKQAVSGPVVYNSRGLVSEEYRSYDEITSSTYTSPVYSLEKTSYEYDPMGRVITVTSADGTISRTHYEPSIISNTVEYGGAQLRREGSLFDAYGRLIRKQELNEGLTYNTYYEYDCLDNLKKVTDAQDNITTINYDTLGRKIFMDDPDMGAWVYEYDKVGNLVRQTDAKGQYINFIYDELNRLTLKSYSTGGSVVYEYDNPNKNYCIGRLSKVTDSSGSTEFYYDNLGREIKSEKTVSGTAYTVEREYDALNRLSKLKYPDNEQVEYSYNNAGALTRVKSLTTGTEYVKDINYNTYGQMTHVWYGNNTTTDYTYNNQTLRLERLATNSGALQDLNYTFDKLGNVTDISGSISGINGNSYSIQKTYTYDNISRLKQAVYAGISPNTNTYEYTYDFIGNITQKNINGNVINYAYGQNGAGPHAVTTYGNIGINYDANGNMTAKGNMVFSYDIENRLKTVSDSTIIPAVKDITLTLSQGWNFISLPVKPTDNKINSVLASIAGKYDQVSRYNLETQEFEHCVGNPDYDQFDSFEYGRGYEIYCTQTCTLTISGSVPKNEKIQLTTGMNLLANPKFSSADTEEALKTLYKDLDYDAVYRYDITTGLFENVTDTQLQAGTAYFVNVLRNAEWIVNKHLGTTTYTYDGDGGRCKKVENIPNVGTTTTTYIGSLYEKQETSGGTKYLKHIYSGASKVCTVESTGTTLYTHGDHLGSSNVITNQNGTVVEHTEYDPYGKVILDEKTGSDGTNYKFTGKELDSNQLYYYGARYYDPELCRFIQPDTIVPNFSNPQSLNRYSYCDNNPVIYTDPTGHWKLKNLLGGCLANKMYQSFQENPTAFLVGLGVGLLTGFAISGMISSLTSACAASGAGITFGEAFMIGGLQAGIPAFTGTFAGAKAAGASTRQAFKAAGQAGAIGFAIGGLIRGLQNGAVSNPNNSNSASKATNSLDVDQSIDDPMTVKPFSRDVEWAPFGKNEHTGWAAEDGTPLCEMGPKTGNGKIRLNMYKDFYNYEKTYEAMGTWKNTYDAVTNNTITYGAPRVVSRSAFFNACADYSAKFSTRQYNPFFENSNFAVDWIGRHSGAGICDTGCFAPGGISVPWDY